MREIYEDLDFTPFLFYIIPENVSKQHLHLQIQPLSVVSMMDLDFTPFLFYLILENASKQQVNLQINQIVLFQ